MAMTTPNRSSTESSCQMTKIERNGCPDFEGRIENNNPGPAATLVQEACDAIYVANAPTDTVAVPVGPRVGDKQPAWIEDRPGGPAANGGRVFVAAGRTCGVVCVQAEEWVEPCRRQFARLGIKAFVQGRPNTSPARSVLVPNGKPRCYWVYPDRIHPPIRMREVVGRPTAEVQASKVTIVGPMAQPDDEAIEVHAHFAANARRAVLQPHPDLLRHRAFGSVAREFDLVVLNFHEAGVLPGLAASIEERAIRLQAVLGEEVDFIITNSAAPGLGWIAGHWWPFEPPQVPVVSDVGPADAFTARFVIERILNGLPPPVALAAAVDTAARWVSGQPLSGPTGNGDALEGTWRSATLSRSCAEVAL
jgi:sugar/nucleoside kinase (ribokinase family)